MNIINLHDLRQNCMSQYPLNFQLIKQLDQLTHTYGSNFSYDRQCICTQSWKIIQQSIKFWQNVNMLISQQYHNQTKMQAYVLIHNRIKYKWYEQTVQIKQVLKNYLCGQTRKYCIGVMDKQRKCLFRKINHMIAQILKYQWNSEWNNYLNQICQIIFNQMSLAQNYFDLLKTIFSQIFSEEEKLTTQEISAIKQQVINSFNNIQKCFEKYLMPDFQPNIVMSCINALNTLIEWIPPHYIFYGYIIQKILNLLKVPILQVISTTCLTNIITSSSSQIVQSFLPKCYSAKRHILLQLLNHQYRKQTKPFVSSIILNKTLQFLEQQKQDILKYQQKTVFETQSSYSDNKFILQLLPKWIAEYAADNQTQDQNILGLYHFISQINQQDSDFFSTIVEMTPCPINTTFYKEQHIIKKDIDFVQCQKDRIKFIQIMKNILLQQQQQYFNCIMQVINQDFLKLKSSRAQKILNKIIWNFYYYLTCVPLHIRVKQKIFAVTNRLVIIQQRLQQTKGNLQNQKLNSLLKIIYIIKFGTIMILSHRKSLKDFVFVQPFKLHLQNGLLEDDPYVKGILVILNTCYNDLRFVDRSQINQRYVNITKSRSNRVQIDLQYAKVIGNWAQNLNQKQNEEAQKMIKQLLEPSLLNVVQRYKKAQQSSQQHQQKLFLATFQLIRLVAILIPYLKSKIISFIRQYIQIIRSLLTIINLSSSDPMYVQYFKLSLEICAANFNQLTLQQVNSNLQNIHQQSLIIIDYGINIFQKSQIIQQQYLQQLFKYFGVYVKRMSQWNLKRQKQLQIFRKILYSIFYFKYHKQLLNVEGFTDFLQCIAKCPLFIQMPDDITSQIIAKIINLIAFQQENKILKAIEIFNSLLILSMHTPVIKINGLFGSQSMTNTISSSNFLYPFILDIIISFYKIIIKLKSSIHYIQQYSNVLFMSLIFVRSMKGTFVPDQQQNNWKVLYQQLVYATKSLYGGYSQVFMTKIYTFLNFVLNINDKDVFKSKMRDLVILLKRGY